MKGKVDQAKGRVKEAAGILTGNEKLKAEGQADQVVGKAKESIEKVANLVKRKIKNARA